MISRILTAWRLMMTYNFQNPYFFQKTSQPEGCSLAIFLSTASFPNLRLSLQLFPFLSPLLVLHHISTKVKSSGYPIHFRQGKRTRTSIDLFFDPDQISSFPEAKANERRMIEMLPSSMVGTSVNPLDLTHIFNIVHDFGCESFSDLMENVYEQPTLNSSQN